MKIERQACALEVKFDAGAAETMSFSGYGAYFGNVDSYGDVIAPGAFRKTLAKARKSNVWPAMLLQHGSFLGGDDNMPVGVWTDMREDDKGLWVEGRLADTQRGRDAYQLLKMQPRPALSGMSIGYRPVEWKLAQSDDEPRRTIKSLELFEVSLVTFPANDDARVEAVKFKLAHGQLPDIREFEKLLREAGFSKTQAAVVAGHGLPELLRREAEGDTATKEGASALAQALADLGQLPSFGRK